MVLRLCSPAAVNYLDTLSRDMLSHALDTARLALLDAGSVETAPPPNKIDPGAF